MKALSIKQPWATLIMCGIPLLKEVKCEDGKSIRLEDTGKVILKDIENRAWPLPGDFKLPQRVAIHISKRDDNFESCFDWFCRTFKGAFGSFMLHYSTKIPRGSIIGEVDITACVTESKSPWFVGPYGFVLANPKLYDKPIPYRGQLGFFEVLKP